MATALPITGDFSDTFTTEIPTVGTFDFWVRWNERAKVWTIDVVESNTKTTLFSGLRLVCNIDLFQDFAVSSTLGRLFVINNLGDGLDPQAAWSSQAYSVVWFPPGEVEAAAAAADLVLP